MSTPTSVVTRPAPWSLAGRWGARGYVSDLGLRLHWIEFGDRDVDDAGSPGGGPPLVLVHGLGGSHLNWTRIGPQLAAGRRVFALDLAGFGLTPAAGTSAGVRANADLLGRFVGSVVGAPVVLVGNSMGGMISALLASGQPDAVAGLVLVDPSLPVPLRRPDAQIAAQFLLYAVPGVGERFMRLRQSRLTARQQVERVVGLCFADPARVDPDVVDAGIELIEVRRSFAGNEAAFLQAARSLMQVLARPGAYRAALSAIAAPVLLVHGEQDRLVPAAAARATAAACPTWDTTFLPGVGHTPQLEAPAAVVDTVTAWLARHPSLATVDTH